MDANALLSGIGGLSKLAVDEFVVEDMLRELCSAAASALDVDGAGVMVRVGARNEVVHSTATDLGLLESLQETAQEGPCTASADALRPVVVNDLRAEDRWGGYRELAMTHDVHAVVAYPLVTGDRVWGVLDLYRRDATVWSEAELRATQTLADVALSYLVVSRDRDLARAAEAALGLRALRDDLTGLANRSLLMDRLEHALAGTERTGAGVAVIFLDLDRFKAINDTWGHRAGDEVLVETARRLDGTLRSGDTLARFAGDEFVIVCQGAGPGGAIDGRVGALAQRLQNALRRPFDLGGRKLAVSASIGVSISRVRRSALELIAEADAAMYDAKRAGHGQVRLRDLRGDII